MLQIYMKTDIGLVRHSNQDAVKAGVLSGNTAWAVVCDGMGGANGGNIASALAVDLISEQILSSGSEHITDQSIKNLMISAIYNANVAIYDRAMADETLAGMGTTVVAAIVSGGVAHIAHAGDSRAYLLTREGLRQITTDHSMVQELVNSGDLTTQQARRHPQKNIITRALGVESGIEIDYCECKFSGDDLLLLCTDGLTNYVEEEQIEQLARELEARLLPDRLIALAKSGGGGDNVTVAVIRH